MSSNVFVGLPTDEIALQKKLNQQEMRDLGFNSNYI